MTTLVLEHLQHADSASPDITIDSSGRVGIGTTVPDGKLTVALENSNTPAFRLSSPTSGTDFAISSYNDANGTYVSMGVNHLFNVSGNDAVMDTNDKSAAIVLDGRNNGRIQFLTNSSGIATPRMTILQDGKVGIGTSSISSGFKTEINHSGETYGIKLTDGSGRNIRFGAGDCEISSSGSNFDIRTTDLRHLIFRTNNVPRMQIHADGHIGFGDNVINDSAWSTVFGARSQWDTKGVVAATNGSMQIGHNWYYDGGGTTGYKYIASGKANRMIHVDDYISWETTDTAGSAGDEITMTEKMRIDSSGRVTMPYQPSFSAHKTSHIVLSGSSSVEAGGWNDSWMSGAHNTGGHFNTSNGRFTVPVAGKYKFDANIMHGDTAGDYQVWLCVNGNTSTCIKSNDMTGAGGSWKQTTLTGIFNLAANDYISIFIRSNVAEDYAVYGSPTAAFTTCNGYLIG